MAVGATFAAGGCLVLQRFFVPGETLRLMQAERVSLPLAWPHQWSQLVADPAYHEVDLSSLRYVGDRHCAHKIAATVGIPHETLGEVVVACVVREASEAGRALDERKVRSFASEQLSSYKVPRRVVFVLEAELEFTTTNKAKKGPLRTLAARRLAEV